MNLRLTTARTTAAAVLLGLVATGAQAGTAQAQSTATPSDVSVEAPARETGAGTLSSLSDADMWRRVEASGKQVVIGLKARGQRRGVWKGKVLATAKQRTAAKAALLSVPGVSIVSEDELLPVVTVRIPTAEALSAVRRLGTVDYVDPVSFDGKVHSDSGAGCLNNDNKVRGGDAYMSSSPIATTTPGDGVPWNFDYARVRDAWDKRKAAGAGTTVGVVDTGTFLEQAQLQSSGFAGGYSSGRWVRHFSSTTSPSLQDQCNHGTRMAGTIAAPRDGKSLVGVAYRSNLVTVRAHDDVWLNGWNVEHVALGVRRAAEEGSKVIAMAFGDAWDHPRLADEIRAQIAWRDVLFIAAAGTDVCWTGVVFPARMPEVIAATGVAAKGGLHPTACGGPEVDIAAVIDTVPALGRYEWDVPITFGGSSDATSVVAGVAAMVRGQKPTWNASQVRTRLLQSGSQSWKHDQYGFGAINAYKATGAYLGLSVSHPGTVAPGTTYTMTARPVGDGPFAYRWSNGATTQSVRVTAGANGTSQTLSVTVTDLTESMARTASGTVSAVTSDPEPIEEPCLNYRYCP